jgi:beta-glucosidase
VQAELVHAVADTGTPVVLVVLSGRIHTLGPLVERAAATLLLFPPGEEGGHGLADVLFGRVNPSGRLPVSLPRAVGQLPVYSGQRAGGTQSRFYGDYTDCKVAPLFPFGHGLSYTVFEYGDLAVAAGSTADPVSVSVRVRNAGVRDGDEVVQLYATDEVASVARRRRALVGFARLAIPAGEERTVAFAVHPSRLAAFDEEMRFVVEPGAFRFDVGASSADIRASVTVELDGDVAVYRQRDVVATAVTVE